MDEMRKGVNVMTIYGYLDVTTGKACLLEKEEYSLHAHNKVRTWSRGEERLIFIVDAGTEEAAFEKMHPFALEWDEDEYILLNDMDDVRIRIEFSRWAYEVVVDGELKYSAMTLGGAVKWAWRNGLMLGATSHMRSDLIF